MTTNQPSQTELSWKAPIHAIETLVVQMNFTHVEAQAFRRFQKIILSENEGNVQDYHYIRAAKVRKDNIICGRYVN